MGSGASGSRRKQLLLPSQGRAVKYAVSSGGADELPAAEPARAAVGEPVDDADETDSAAAVQVTTTECAEVQAVLEAMRDVRVRSLPLRALEALAESSTIEEYAPGSKLNGPRVWMHGLSAVLSGAASVVITVGNGTSCNKLEIATLQKGDSFGSLGKPSAADLDCGLDRLQLSIAVAAGECLRVARLDESEAKWHLRSVSKSVVRQPSTRLSLARGAPLFNSDNNLGPDVDSERHHLSERLGRLWLAASPPERGIGEQSAGLVRVHFQAALWAPLLERLEQYNHEIRRRKDAGYRQHECFPLQGHQIAELTEHVRHVTEIWYGSARGGNLSAVYRWFVQAMEILGVTAYSYDLIPKEVTPDGWARVVDGDARRVALQGKGNSDSLHVATGDIAQRQGRSAIDNTVLRNVFLPHEARELLVGRRIRKFISKVFAIRQRCILMKLSEHFLFDFLWLAQEAGTSKGHRVVRTVLQSIPPEEVRAAGVAPEGVCFRELILRGTIIAGFGQLALTEQKAVWMEVRRLLHQTHGVPKLSSASLDSPDVFERLVAWSRDFPAEYFEHNKHRHVMVLISGMFAGHIIVIRRSAMERMTLARYFPISWRRSQPLWGGAASGPFHVRTAGIKEASNVRANECPYTTLHGMSLSAGGFASDHRAGRKGSHKFSLLMEMQWVYDPSANIENWYIIDVEKIVQEAWQLNPHGPAKMMLPGEVFVCVGQNPKVGSSIKQTQHTQLCQGSVRDYKILQETSASGPRYSAKLNALFDVVELGPVGAEPEQCGLMVKVTTPCPVSLAVLSFFVELRHHLLTRFSGNSIDFLVLTLCDERGNFSVIFAPIPQLVKIGDEHPDLATWANPLTGESSDTAGLEETRIDFGKGVGHFLVAKPELKAQLLQGGEDTLRRIWAFNRVPGLRDEVLSFVEGWSVFSSATFLS